CTQIAQLDAVGVVAALRVLGTNVRERKIRAELQGLDYAMAALEADRAPRVVVVRADDHAPRVGIVSGEVEGRAIVPPRDGHAVVEGIAHPIQLVRVIVYGRAGSQRGPSPRAHGDAGIMAVASQRGFRMPE